MSEYDTETYEELLRQDNIICKLADMPVFIKGLAVKKGNTYLILINAKYDDMQRRKIFIHEMSHLRLGHLELKDIALKYPMLEAQVATHLNLV
jgi:hypothetical protein